MIRIGITVNILTPKFSLCNEWYLWYNWLGIKYILAWMYANQEIVIEITKLSFW